MNKKGEQEEGFGETGNAIKAVTMLVAATIMTLLLVGITNHAISKQLTADARVDQFLTFEAVRHCFLYENNGRVYYDTVDLNKFNEQRLKECLPEKSVAVTLSRTDGTNIKTLEKGLSTTSSSSSYSYYVNLVDDQRMYVMRVRSLV